MRCALNAPSAPARAATACASSELATMEGHKGRLSTASFSADGSFGCNVIPQILGGTIKVYAIAAPERLPSLPSVSTTGEAGVDFIFRAWNAMVAPNGTPNEIVAKLVNALGQALDDPAVQARYVELGSSAPKDAERGPAGLQKLVESEVARITPIIEAAGVTN